MASRADDIMDAIKTTLATLTGIGGAENAHPFELGREYDQFALPYAFGFPRGAERVIDDADPLLHVEMPLVVQVAYAFTPGTAAASLRETGRTWAQRVRDLINGAPTLGLTNVYLHERGGMEVELDGERNIGIATVDYDARYWRRRVDASAAA